MRLCFVCGEYPPLPHGGIGSFTQSLARAMVAHGHSVRVVGVVGSHEIEVLRRAEDSGVQVLRLPAPNERWGWLGARVALFRQIRRWAARGDVDLVEVPDWQGWAAGWPTLPVPVLARLHGSATYFAAEAGAPVSRRTRWLEGASLRRADAWCGVSAYVAHRTKALFADGADRPVGVLHNPVELGAGARARRKGMVVFAGRLTRKKGVERLADAWRIVAERYPDAELHLFGADEIGPSGSLMSQALVQRMGAQAASCAHFHGPVPRDAVRAALAQAHAAVFPSRAEAFAMAPLEAMAAGCPTIYSRVGSGPELITHGLDGLLVDPDSAQDIASALLKVLADDTLARRLGEAARHTARHRFGMATLVPQNESLYRQCIDRFRRHASATRWRWPRTA